MLEPAIAASVEANGRPIVVTGASGWIGMATLDALEQVLGAAFNERIWCFGSSARTLDLGGGRRIEQRPLQDLASLKVKQPWILHFAFQAKDRAETMSEVAYRVANRMISDTLFAALDAIDAEAIFVASSGAAIKADDPAASPAMRLYGEMKRDDEVRFANWAAARGRRAVIGRIFNITGPYINKHQAYAMASFILDALAGRPIAVHAPRPVIRGYVAVHELLSLVFALLNAAPDGVERFETGGEALELGEVAARVAEVLGGRSTRAPITEPTADRYVGSDADYQALLTRHGIASVPLDRQILDTAAFLGQDTQTSTPVLASGGDRR